MSPGLHDRMIVSWVSNSTDGDHLVMWGVAADSLNETAAATHDTYTADDFTNCMGIAPIDTLQSPFSHISTHDLRSCLPLASFTLRLSHKAPTRVQVRGVVLRRSHLQPALPPPRLHAQRRAAAAAARAPILLQVRKQRRWLESSLLFCRISSPRRYNSLHIPVRASAPCVSSERSCANGVHNCSGRYTADAGIGNPPLEEQGGACHNDPPANGADSVFAAMIRDPATAKDEMVIVNGDISYARGWPWIWERYFDLIQPLATMMPWMVRLFVPRLLRTLA
jgi:hypothetical protein